MEYFRGKDIIKGPQRGGFVEGELNRVIYYKQGSCTCDLTVVMIGV